MNIKQYIHMGWIYSLLIFPCCRLCSDVMAIEHLEVVAGGKSRSVESLPAESSEERRSLSAGLTPSEESPAC